MLVCRIATVFLVLVFVSAQNPRPPPAPAAPPRNPRTIQTFLTNVGDLFGYDVFKRPRIVINIPAAFPPAVPGPPPPPAPAPAPAGPPPPRPPPGPPPAPAPPPAGAASPAIAATNLLTDSVRRQFSINLNWDRNQSPPQNEPVISAVVVSPPGLAVPAPAASAPVAAIPAAPVPPPPPREREREGDRERDREQERVVDYEEQEEYEDRPKRFHIEIPDYINLEDVSEPKREISNAEASKINFKQDFKNYWQNAPWTVERGYKYIVPQGSEKTLMQINKPNEIPNELSKYEEITLPKENKVRSLKVTQRVKLYGNNPLTASSTAITYIQKPPSNGEFYAAPSYLTSRVVNAELLNYFNKKNQRNPPKKETEAEPSYLTSKVVNAELLNFYKHKFENDATDKQQQANQAEQVSNNHFVSENENQSPHTQVEGEKNYQDYPLNMYAFPENFHQGIPADTPVVINYIQEGEPLDFYSKPESGFRIEINSEEVNDKQQNIAQKHEEVNEHNEKEDENNDTKTKNEDDAQNENNKGSTILYNNEKENLEVEHIHDNENENETEEAEEQKDKSKREPESRESSTNEENEKTKDEENEDIKDEGNEEIKDEEKEKTKDEENEDIKDEGNEEIKDEEDTTSIYEKVKDKVYDYQDIDSFIKTHFGDVKSPDYDTIRENIEAEGDARAEQANQESNNDETESADENSENEEATAENEETKDETEESKDENQQSKNEAEELAKIEELKNQHETEFHAVFPKLGQGTEYEDFYNSFSKDKNSDKNNLKSQETEKDSSYKAFKNTDADEDGEKDSSKTIEKYKPKNQKLPNNQKQNSKGKDSVKHFDINDNYKKAKENFATKLTKNNEHKFPKERQKPYVKSEPKKQFTNKENYESTEKSVVHPLYSGVWHIGNLQELYKLDKPVTVPFDHEYSASEYNNKNARSKREITIEDFTVDGEGEIELYEKENDEYSYVPDKYTEDFTHEVVPEPQLPDFKKLEAKEYKEVSTNLSPNAQIDMKSIGIQVNTETKNTATFTESEIREETDPYQRSLTEIFDQLKTDLVNLHSHIGNQSLKL